jgi:hypothetical protein
MVRGARQDLAHPAIVISRFQFEIGVTERIDDEIPDVPRCDAKHVQADKMIDDGQQSKKADIEHQLFREREGDCRKRAVQATLVVLQMYPMQRAQMKGSVRAVVPNLGPNRRQNPRIEERRQSRVFKKAKVEEDRQHDRMHRCMKGIPQLSPDLLFANRQIVYGSRAYFPFFPVCNIPKQRHNVSESGDKQENENFRRGEHDFAYGDATSVPEFYRSILWHEPS